MKVAIVTGATKGIGKVIALKMAELSYSLVVVGRDIGLLDSVKDTIESKGGICYSISADLTLDESYETIIQETISHFGQIDILINNAGMAVSGSIAETALFDWDLIHTVNAKAPFFLSKATIPHLKKSLNPFIINIGSVVGFKGYENQSAYVSSKHALTGFTKVLAKEVQKEGIRVHLISPGGVNTEMIQEMRPDIDFEQLIQPEEIAEIIEFLVTRKGRGTIDHLYIRRQGGVAFD